MQVNTLVTTGTIALDVTEIAVVEAFSAGEWRITLKSGKQLIPDEPLRHALALKLGLPFPWHADTVVHS